MNPHFESRLREKLNARNDQELEAALEDLLAARKQWRMGVPQYVKELQAQLENIPKQTQPSNQAAYIGQLRQELRTVYDQLHNTEHLLLIALRKTHAQ